MARDSSPDWSSSSPVERFPTQGGTDALKPLWPETHSGTERTLIEGYRRMSDGEKMCCMVDLATLAAQLAEEVRHRHPGADERELQLRATSRWLEANLLRKAYNRDPDTEEY